MSRNIPKPDAVCPEDWDAMLDELERRQRTRVAQPPPSEPASGEATTTEEFTCMARPTADPPQECDFPFCGCSRNATEAVESLIECGWLNQGEAQQLKAELAGYKQVVSKCWSLAKDFIASRVERDKSIAVDLDFLVGRMLREITVLEARRPTAPATAEPTTSHIWHDAHAVAAENLPRILSGICVQPGLAAILANFAIKHIKPTAPTPAEPPNIEQWKSRCIDYFRSGKASQAEWDHAAMLLLYAAENSDMDESLDETIQNHQPAPAADAELRRRCAELQDANAELVAENHALERRCEAAERDMDLLIAAHETDQTTLISERTMLFGRLRTTAQTLIAAIGADGPQNAEEAAERIVATLAAERAERAAAEGRCEAMREALEAWKDWLLGKYGDKDPLEFVVADNPPGAVRPRQCDYCCCSPEVEDERKHPWHYDDCPVAMLVEALSVHQPAAAGEGTPDEQA